MSHYNKLEEFEDMVVKAINEAISKEIILSKRKMIHEATKRGISKKFLLEILNQQQEKKKITIFDDEIVPQSKELIENQREKEFQALFDGFKAKGLKKIFFRCSHCNRHNYSNQEVVICDSCGRDMERVIFEDDSDDDNTQ